VLEHEGPMKKFQNHRVLLTGIRLMGFPSISFLYINLLGFSHDRVWQLSAGRKLMVEQMQQTDRIR
jgi:hypothetical protein